MLFTKGSKKVVKFQKLLLPLQPNSNNYLIMAAILFLGDKNKDGLAPIIVRVQSKKHKIQVRQQIGLLISPTIWDNRKNERVMKGYSQNPVIMKTLRDAEEIRLIINRKLDNDVILDKKAVREIINSVVYRRQLEEEAEAAEEAARLEAEANRVTLLKFIDKYIKEIETGARQTDKGMNYSPNTVKAVKQALTQFKNFCKAKKKDYDFADIDMQFYHDFTAYLKSEIKDRKGNVKKKAYAVNSIGKCIKQLKVIMFTAETEGYHTNSVWKDKRFKGTRIDVDSIYLTKDDLAAIMAVDLSKYDAGHTYARDIFMVGCWIAQRVSDYNNISKDQIDVLNKRWIEDVPDPEHPGQTKPEIRTKEIMYVNIRQQKTGVQVSVPVSPECKAILEKYDYKLPHLEDQVINRYLKDICRDAGLTDEVEIVETNGGTPKRVKKQKWELVHTHTARRTGATLMYLAGMDVYDIIKITGHTTPVMLRKYIRADKLEVVEKITDKYDYFN